MSYNEETSKGYNSKICSREGIRMFNDLEAPGCSRALGNIVGLRVLDLGCGSGRYTRWLKTSQHAGEVIGVDMSEHMIEEVNSNNNVHTIPHWAKCWQQVDRTCNIS